MASLSGIYDAAGVLYGGANYAQIGVGDVVKDFNGNTGTVISIRPGWPGKNPEIDVVLASGLYPMNGLPTDGPPPPGLIPGVSTGVLPLERTVYAFAVTIVSHADGSPLVGGGPVTPMTDANPHDKYFFDIS